ncbi:hypothetical protein [Rariglobus hedericola]|uniref:FtsX-like permease family protein n=1 Tax=Rariglobus hedericola TaxID=2597822 RepID=A0A556QIU8_9BACT|nr:hypothetical protein [Rariglobus hedericola]TSJ76557.1 hypothetical protein FPL22_10520 [Rariglobus hedericola]
MSRPSPLFYLWHETLARWREQPSSPLVRLALTTTLSAAAAWFWLGSTAQETALARELERQGFDTAVIRASAMTSLPELSAALPADHWAAGLSEFGETRLLQALPLSAARADRATMPTYLAPWTLLAKFVSSPNEALWLTTRLPPGQSQVVWISGQPVRAQTARPETLWSALGEDDTLIIPPALVPPATTAAGRVDVVLFRPTQFGATEAPLATVRMIFAGNQLPPPFIQDPGPRLVAFARLQTLGQVWRLAVLALLGACVVLTFTAIGVLEERQTRYTQALLRSLGSSRLTIWGASLVENLLLANLALIAAGLTLFAAPSALAVAGLRDLTTIALPFEAWLAITAIVNVGLFFSLIPLGCALRRPLGFVLP